MAGEEGHEVEVKDVLKILLVYLAVFVLIWMSVFTTMLERGVISGTG